MSYLKRMAKGRHTGTESLVESLQSSFVHNGNPLKSSTGRLGNTGIEGLDEVTASDLDNNLDDLSTRIIEATNEIDENGETVYTEEQIKAAQGAAIAAANPDAIAEATSAANNMTGDGVVRPESLPVSQTSVERLKSNLKAGTEAYDETENRNAMIFSCVYNLKAARQDEFGEALFPTIVLAPDQAFAEITMDILSVEDEFHHDIKGSAANMFGRKNVARGLIYGDILKDESTRVYPIYRDTDPDNKAHFVDTAKVAAKTIEIKKGVSITTAPIKADGRVFNLLGLSQTDYLIAQGVFTQTDSLDPFAKLEETYIELKDGTVIKYGPLDNLPSAGFNYAVQGLSRRMELSFHWPHAPLDAETLDAKGKKVSDTLTVLKTAGLTVRLDITVHADINLIDGDSHVQPGNVFVTDVHDKNGNKLATSDTSYKAVLKAFEDAKLLGVTFVSRRTNSNRRDRGKLMALNRTRMRYALPILPPITYLRPTNESDVSDGARVDSLILTTNIRCSNQAVETLLNAEQLLKQLPSKVFEPQEVDSQTTLGMARYLVNPWYEHKDLDVKGQINSLNSQGRLMDVNSVLVNNIRDMVYRGYVMSGYQAASDAVFGPGAKKPKVVIATDPYIAGYLMVQGDIRLLVEQFEVQVVSTLNTLMKGKIRIVFGKSDASGNDLSNPLHFGNMLWRPELVTMLPVMARGNTASRELSVQPSFIHIVNCPIMMAIDIVGGDVYDETNTLAKAVADSIPVATKSVP